MGIAIILAIFLVLVTASFHYFVLRWLSGGMARIAMSPGHRHPQNFSGMLRIFNVDQSSPTGRCGLIETLKCPRRTVPAFSDDHPVPAPRNPDRSAERFSQCAQREGSIRMSTTGRVAVVTGGTREIGAAVARALQSDGHTVTATYHGNEGAAAAFREQSGIRTHRWDIADFSACQAGIGEIERDLGPIEILVNNAGITRDVSLHRMTPDQWHAVIETNLSSCFNVCRAVIDGMRQRGFGRVVNISSINGQKGQIGQTNYAAAKAGILGFTKALALETASKGITVNAVAPGYVETDMVAAVPKESLQKIVA